MGGMSIDYAILFVERALVGDAADFLDGGAFEGIAADDDFAGMFVFRQ